MSTGLPPALFNISTETLPVPISITACELRFLRYQTFGRFWKIFAATYKFSKQPADRRAENIFWRLWSDSIHREVIGENGLEQLCTICQQPFDITPFHLVMPTRSSLRPAQDYDYAGKQPSHNQVSASSGSSDGSRKDDSETVGSAVEAPADIARRPERVLLSDIGRPKPSRAASSRNLATRANPTPKERNAVATAAGGSKARRPALGKRMSSSSAYIKSGKSPNTGAKQGRREDDKQQTSENKIYPKPFELPSASSWEDEPSNSGSHVPSPARSRGGSAELEIDPDFRNKFAEKIASSLSLAIPNEMRKSGSIVRFAEDANDETIASSPKAFRTRPPVMRHHSIASSVAISDDEEDEEDSATQRPATLQRSRSQLSFLILERRATQGEESLSVPSEPLAKEDKKSRRKKAEDEEVLAMAQRQGVTKAGGIQVPRQHRVDTEIDSRYSSPDRDFTF